MSAEPTPPHRPAMAPHASLYFAYRVHAPAPATPVRELPALVVGAGPIGLVTALGLAQQGVRCVVLAAELQVCEGSRAIVFTRRSMEILQQAGVAEAIVAKGLPWRCGNSFYRGQRVFRMEAPQSPDDRFGPLTNLQQQFVEQFLVEAATLSVLGAAIGGALGVALAKVIAALTPLPASVAPLWLLFALVVGAGVGIVAGIYPASRASRLDKRLFFGDKLGDRISASMDAS